MPTGALRSLWMGAETVSSHPALLLIPIAVDLLIWLGPHLSVQPIVNPILAFMSRNASLSGLSPQDTAQSMAGLVDIGKHLNLVALLAFLPLFPPSLMASEPPLSSPMGSPLSLQVSSIPFYVLVALALGLAGLFLGSLYWVAVGHAVRQEKEAVGNRLYAWLRVSVGVIVLGVAAAIVLTALAVPAGLLIGIADAISPLAGQIALVVVGGLALWMLVFLVFTIHGMVLTGDLPPRAVGKSIEVVRWSYASALSWVLLTVLVLLLTNSIWTLPAENSWTRLVGVLGNAYTSSALVAGSLIFYRDRRRWVEEMRQYLEQRNRASEGGPTANA
ncbi:MAG: hypothetical protein ABSG98_07435 [Anaerolineales bacterium]|jgi:hypothetical protein